MAVRIMAVRRLINLTLLRIRLIATSRLSYCLLALLTLLLLAPSIASFPTGADYRYGSDSIKSLHSFSKDQLSSGQYATAPDELVSLKEREVEALEDAVSNAHPYSSPYYEAIARYQSLQLEEFRKGYLVGVDDSSSLEAACILTRRISQLATPETYARVSDAPGMYLMSYAIGAIPPAAWSLVPVVMFAALGKRFGRRLADRGPASSRTSAAALALASTIGSVVAIIAALVVAFAAASIQNGIGQPDYPVVYISSGQVVESTVLVQVLLFLLFESLYAACLSCAMGSLLNMSRSRVATIGATLLLIMAPSIPLYSQPNTPWFGVLELLPSTYLGLSALTGQAAYANTQDISPVPGATASTGVLVLIVFAGALVVIDHIVGLTPNRQRWRRPASADPIASDSGTQCFAYIERLEHSSKTCLIRDSSLSLKAGEIAGLVAPNGYGKTTLLNALWGVMPSRSSACVYFDGKACTDSLACRSSFFMLEGTSDLLYAPLSVRSHLLAATRLWNRDVDLRAIEQRFDLADIAKRPVGKLSQGNQQLVCLAIACIAHCSVILLDEPMNALDPSHVTSVKRTLRQLADEGSCILLSSHILSDLEDLCDSTFFIANGRLEKMERGDGENIRAAYNRIFQVQQEGSSL